MCFLCLLAGLPDARHVRVFNPLESRGNYSATVNNMKLVHWPLMGELLHLVLRGGDCVGPQPAQALLAVPNVTVHPTTASVPIILLKYNGSLLRVFNAAMKGLNSPVLGRWANYCV